MSMTTDLADLMPDFRAKVALYLTDAINRVEMLRAQCDGSWILEHLREVDRDLRIAQDLVTDALRKDLP